MSKGGSGARDDRAAVDKAVSVLRAFGAEANGAVGVSELARRAGLSKSTAFRLLTSLEGNGAVERVGTGYRLGGVIRELSELISAPQHARLSELLTPFLVELHAVTSLTAQLAVLHGYDVVYLNKIEGHRRLRTPARIGGRMPAYCTALGKALLARDADAAEQALAAPRPARTPRTITDTGALREELRRVARVGVAVDQGESLPSLRCIAGPVHDADGRVIAAISVSGPAASFRPTAVEHALRRVCFHASQVTPALRSASSGRAHS